MNGCGGTSGGQSESIDCTWYILRRNVPYRAAAAAAKREKEENENETKTETEYENLDNLRHQQQDQQQQQHTTTTTGQTTFNKNNKNKQRRKAAEGMRRRGKEQRYALVCSALVLVASPCCRVGYAAATPAFSSAAYGSTLSSLRTSFSSLHSPLAFSSLATLCFPLSFSNSDCCLSLSFSVGSRLSVVLSSFPTSLPPPPSAPSLGHRAQPMRKFEAIYLLFAIAICRRRRHRQRRRSSAFGRLFGCCCCSHVPSRCVPGKCSAATNSGI